MKATQKNTHTHTHTQKQKRKNNNFSTKMNITDFEFSIALTFFLNSAYKINSKKEKKIQIHFYKLIYFNKLN